MSENLLMPNGDFLYSYPQVTRVEVITNNGRELVRYECSNVQVSLQDDGRTIKVFLSQKQIARPNRLIKDDVWEFELEVKVKGKRNLQLRKLQFKVIGYHNGECAWQLMSLDGEHYTYLLEYAPQYEDMTYIGCDGAK
jgi:hypothetical protein